MNYRFVLAFLLAFPLVLGELRTFAAEDPVFEKDILPIFEMNCVVCHGTIEPQGNLVLLDFASTIKGGAKGAILKPGDSAESKLMQLISAQTAPKMPPDPLLPLAKGEVELIKKWIDTGAKSSVAVNPPKEEPKAEEKKKETPKAEAAPVEKPAAPLEKKMEEKPSVKSAMASPAVHAQSPEGPVGAIAFHPAKTLLAVGRLHTVELFSIDTDRNSLTPVAVLPGHAQVVRALAFSPDGSTLAAAGGRPAVKGEVILWNVETHEKIAQIQGHNDCIYDVKFSPDGSQIATCSYDRLIKLWNVKEAKEEKTLKDHVDAVYKIAYSPDGTRLASVAADRTLKIWSVADGKRIYTLSEPLGALFSLAFHPSGKKIIAAGEDKMIREWELGETNAKLTISKFSHEGAVLGLAYSPDGKTIYSTAEDKLIKAWETETYLETLVYPPQSDWVDALALDAMGEMIAAGRYDGTLAVYNTKSGEMIASTDAPALSQPELKPVNKPVPSPKKDEPVQPLLLAGDKVSGATSEASQVLNDDPSLVRVVQGNGTYLSALSGMNPKAFTRGKTVEVTLTGKNLDDPEILIETPGITAKIVENTKRPFENLVRQEMNTSAEIVDTGRPHTLKVELTVADDVEPGIYSLRARTALATSNAVSFAVEDSEAVLEKEENDTVDKAQKVEFPAILAGAMNRFGDADHYRFEAEAGQEWVFTTTASALGSGINSVMEILSPNGDKLASSEDFSQRRDALMGFRAAESGTYILRVSDKEFRSDVSYRIHASQRPLITKAFPLGGRKGEKTPIQAEGFNLQGAITAMLDIPAEHEGREMSLTHTTPAGSAVNTLKLAAGDFAESFEQEGNDSVENAQAVTAPVTINGLIYKSEGEDTDNDYFRFSAKKGERLIVAVGAQQFGSPLDSIIEITHADGSPVSIATVRCVSKTFLTLADRDSRTSGLRLDSYGDLRINDYMMVGTEILRVTRLPDYADEDVAFANSSMTGTRIAFFGTTPGYHAVNEFAYKVEIHEPGKTFPPNGMPVYTMFAMNDDGGAPAQGRDSYLAFDPPQDGDYVVKITDTYGRGSHEHAYRLSIRPPQPDFQFIIDTDKPNIPARASWPLRFVASRFDGFNGPIQCEVKDLPEGFTATQGTILPGEDEVTISITAGPGAKTTEQDKRFKVIARAEIDGKEVVRESSFGMITVTQQPDVVITQEPTELTLIPGQTVPVTVKIKRQNGFSGRVPIQDRNLPLGVFVTDTGLNGILITEKEEQRTYNIYAEPWVKDMDIKIFSIANVETRSPLPNRNVSNESVLKIRGIEKVVQK